MPKADDDQRKDTEFGPSGADDKGEGQTEYDRPATPAEDTATDERRDKPIRGPEPHDAA